MFDWRKLLGLLGAGALGLTAFWLGGNRRPKAPRPKAPRPKEKCEGPPSEAPAKAAPPIDAMPAEAQGAWIAGPAGSLRIVELHPTAPRTLVFIHGLGGRLEMWAPLLRDLGPGLRAVALDLPGHGRSDAASDSDYSVPALAAAIGAVLDGLSLRRAVLVAHSLGAAAAIEYAGRTPGRIEGLLLVDPSGDQTVLPKAAQEAFLAPLRRDPEGEFAWYFRQILGQADPRTAELVLESLAATPPEILLAALEGSATHSPRPALERYAGPLLMVVGELNEGPSSLPALRPDLPARRLAYAGHWLMLDRREAVREALFEVLGAAGSSRTT